MCVFACSSWSDEANTGYQMVQSLMSIGSGGLTGLPWGQGSGKFFYLPEAHTDFAFAIFCQEWGLLGAAILHQPPQGVTK